MAEKKDTKLNKKTPVNRKSKASNSLSKKTIKDTQKKNTIDIKPLPNVLLKFRNDVMPDLMKKHQFTTPMAVPKLVKIVINVGVGEALVNSKITDTVIKDLEVITGKKQVTRKARKASKARRIKQSKKKGQT